MGAGKVMVASARPWDWSEGGAVPQKEQLCEQGWSGGRRYCLQKAGREQQENNRKSSEGGAFRMGFKGWAALGHPRGKEHQQEGAGTCGQGL